MKFFPLIWAMLWRSKARAWLTFCSIAIAFFLFGMLQALHASFTAGVRAALDDVLIVTYRQGLIRPLPAAYLSRISAIKGVEATAAISFLPGSYQDPKNPVTAVAVDLSTGGATDRSIVIADDQLNAFLKVRTAALAGRDVAAKYGWKIGDRIPLKSSVPRKDGLDAWEFDLVGFFTYDEEISGARRSSNFILVHRAYVDEAVLYSGWVTWYRVRIADPQQAAQMGQAIDREFLNSPFETRTQPEREFQQGFLQQFADVGAMIAAILGAVFFTLILVAGNAMMQAFRERVPELAVLKTVGFNDRQAAGLVVAESLLLCVFAAAVGLGLALALAPPLRTTMDQFLTLAIEPATLAGGAAVAISLALLSAAIPAWKSARLSVVAALGGK